MIGCFQRCQAQFERIYVNGERIPPGISARRGSSTHEAIRLNHSHKLHADDDLPVDVLQDAARDEYLRLVKEESVFIPKADLAAKDRLLNDGLNAAVKLTGLYHREVAPAIKPVLVEERVNVDVGLPLILSGGIDCYTVDGWLPDFKTADKSKAQRFADQSLQLTFYAGLIFHQRGEWPAKCSLDVLVDNQVARYQHLETTRGPADFDALVTRIDVICQQIFSGIFPPCDPGAWICSPRWCGFYESCKYASKRR
jgi:RecB family exonuclease